VYAVDDQLALINVSYSAAPASTLGHESSLRVSVLFLSLLSPMLDSKFKASQKSLLLIPF
jgi:hypothetical protein